jgi:hypothetical protein
VAMVRILKRLRGRWLRSFHAVREFGSCSAPLHKSVIQLRMLA